MMMDVTQCPSVRKTFSHLRLVLGLLVHNKMALKQLYTQDAVGNNSEEETKRRKANTPELPRSERQQCFSFQLKFHMN